MTETYQLNRVSNQPNQPSAAQDYAAFIEWRYDVIAEICERIRDEERYDDGIDD